MSFVFEVQLRTDLGKGASRRLRHANKVPAVVYGKGEPVSVTLDHDALFHAQEDKDFYTSELTLKVEGGEDLTVKVQDIQRHAFKPKVVHMDFVRA